jgi:hypothetical protein
MGGSGGALFNERHLIEVKLHQEEATDLRVTYLMWI